jgi:hypothetical protein
MSDVMDGPALRALYTEYCKPARVLDRLEDRLVDRMCEVMKEYLHSKARGIVKAANGRAVLFSYGSDSTPSLTWTTIKSDHTSGAVTRKAKKAEELLIEVGFIKTTTPT